MMKTSEPLVIETFHRHGVVQLTLNRPNTRNAFSFALYNEVIRLLRNHAKLDFTRLIILTGAGSSFCSGMDVKEAAKISDPSKVTSTAGAFMKALCQFNKPILTAVFGNVVGIGVTLLTHCDMVIAAEDTQFSTPFIRTGVLPEYASTVLFPKYLGLNLTTKFLLRGEKVTSKEMEAVGACEVVKGGRNAVIARAVELAQAWSAGCTNEEWESVMTSKRLLKQGLEGIVERAIEREMEAIIQKMEQEGNGNALRQRVNTFGRRAKM